MAKPHAPLPLGTPTFFYRALFSASLGYLAVALFILRPDNGFGLAHIAWAIVCVVGSWKVLKAAKTRDDASPKQPPPSQST